MLITGRGQCLSKRGSEGSVSFLGLPATTVDTRVNVVSEVNSVKKV